MPIIQVGGYHAYLAGSRSAGSDWMALTLRPDDSYPAEITAVSIYFIDNPRDAGYVTRSGVVFTPRGPLTFDRFYHLLQTEQPLYFSWGADSSNRLIYAQLGTTEKEPIGEGVMGDTSL